MNPPATSDRYGSARVRHQASAAAASAFLAALVEDDTDDHATPGELCTQAMRAVALVRYGVLGAAVGAERAKGTPWPAIAAACRLTLEDTLRAYGPSVEPWIDGAPDAPEFPGLPPGVTLAPGSHPPDPAAARGFVARWRARRRATAGQGRA